MKAPSQASAPCRAELARLKLSWQSCLTAEQAPLNDESTQRWNEHRHAAEPAGRIIPYADLASLRQRRQWLDRIILTWAAGVSAGELDSVLDYRNTRSTAFRRSLGGLVLHFFNHQTHHRGHVTTLRSQAGVDVGVTDLAALIPQLD